MNDETRDAPIRGWSSRNLKVVPSDDDRYWSVSDAATIVESGDLVNVADPVKRAERQVQAERKIGTMIRLAGLEPVGKRYNGPRRRHVRVYRAVDLLNLVERFAELAPGSD